MRAAALALLLGCAGVEPHPLFVGQPFDYAVTREGAPVLCASGAAFAGELALLEHGTDEQGRPALYGYAVACGLRLPVLGHFEAQHAALTLLVPDGGNLTVVGSVTWGSLRGELFGRGWPDGLQFAAEERRGRGHPKDWTAENPK